MQQVSRQLARSWWQQKRPLVQGLGAAMATGVAAQLERERDGGRAAGRRTVFVSTCKRQPVGGAPYPPIQEAGMVFARVQSCWRPTTRGGGAVAGTGGCFLREPIGLQVPSNCVGLDRGMATLASKSERLAPFISTAAPLGSRRGVQGGTSRA